VNAALMVGVEQDVSIVSFSAPVRALSWAVLNGGFCYADHIINHQVQGKDASFCAQPRSWLQQAATKLGLNGKVVAIATAAEMKNLTQASMSGSGAEVTCFATVGCGNALSAGDPASGITEKAAQPSLHTINMIAMVQPGLTDQAMVEAIQIATEGRVRALYEAGIQSSASNLLATGTGTDCIAIVSLDAAGATYCGKHTNLGELIGLAAYTAVKKGLMQGATTSASTPQGNGNHGIEE
jgi:adenosylcobinamide amidohydrolase